MRILITGAAGFIGREACEFFAMRHHEVIGMDDMSRPTARIPNLVEFHEKDINDIFQMDLPPIDIIIHLASKVSITRSISSPFSDYYTNIHGTMKMIQWALTHGVRNFIYSSTNKVFGDLPGVYHPIEDGSAIDPKTPYGVSKCAAALYVRELLPASGYVFHQSCIYGDSQIGTIDQGWAAYVKKQIKLGNPIICFGDGSQIRDLLHIKDLLRAYDMVLENRIPPDSYVIGGGIENTISFNDFVTLLKGRIKSYEGWRPHDQKYFVSDNTNLRKMGWNPEIKAMNWISS